MFLSRLVILVAVLTNLDVYIPAVKTCNLEHENDKKKKKKLPVNYKTATNNRPFEKKYTNLLHPALKKKNITTNNNRL